MDIGTSVFSGSQKYFNIYYSKILCILRFALACVSIWNVIIVVMVIKFGINLIKTYE